MTTEERTQTIDLLFAESCSCVIRNSDQLRIFRERGVKDLHRLLKEEPKFLHGAFVADKVVGKAAAALMILGEVKEVFADTISRQALDLLKKSRVEIAYTLEVPHIINRTQTGWCPLETRCRDLKTPKECLVQIDDFIDSMKNNA